MKVKIAVAISSGRTMYCGMYRCQQTTLHACALLHTYIHTGIATEHQLTLSKQFTSTFDAINFFIISMCP